jgi:hypothetical protein
MTPAIKNETEAAILRKIAFIAIDGLNPALSRIDLVNKMKLIYGLADKECRESDFGSDDNDNE